MSLPTYAGIEAYGFSCQEQLLSQRSVARAYPGGELGRKHADGVGFPLQTVW
jgi:hypothetical protein